MGYFRKMMVVVSVTLAAFAALGKTEIECPEVSREAALEFRGDVRDAVCKLDRNTADFIHEELQLRYDDNGTEYFGKLCSF